MTQSSELTVSRSRREIEKMLRKWGVASISWVDDYEVGIVVLRFRWKTDPEDRIGYTARFTICVPKDEELEKRAVDKRTGKYSEKKMQRLRKNRGRKQHRTLLYLIRTQLDAVQEGLMAPEQVFLAWVEDEVGTTLFDRMLPELRELSGAAPQKAIGESEDA